jgi:hypothetical protein
VTYVHQAGIFAAYQVRHQVKSFMPCQQTARQILHSSERLPVNCQLSWVASVNVTTSLLIHMHCADTDMQGENLIHGLACRLEERMAKGGGGPMSDLFGVLHTLADTGSESFKVRHTNYLEPGSSEAHDIQPAFDASPSLNTLYHPFCPYIHTMQSFNTHVVAISPRRWLVCSS